MNILFWEKTKFTLPTEEIKALQILLPYWGLKSVLDQSKIVPALTDCKVDVRGLNSSSFRDLNKTLRHTEVSLCTTTKSISSEVEFLISYEETLSYPISLTVMNMTYNLKPCGRYGDLKQVIHEQIWLPAVLSPIIVRIHPRLKEYTVQWLNYLIIQSFHRKTFQPLDEISFSIYRKIVDRILMTINPDFAKLQLNHLSTLNEWPDLPKMPSHLNETSPNQTKKDSLSTFSNQQKNQETTTFNPFKFQTKTNEAKIINPFQNKH
ncbi:hypothetical protein GLW07_09450 [Bacillus hwajinpoensis]|uniref:Uncharacterized protein n=1 Tax=Guptibacillus hwajinpoensis TaxID=208199 RepID=A0A845EYH8_9BACL|nr:hypothetical protein [Pseudalkalibacillus hwajinpoensis]MYL63577.1 hypothetical protein [Pseudalkalibacillus hwajinpoensis]